MMLSQQNTNSDSRASVSAGNDFSMGKFAADILQTRECRQALDSLLSDFFNQWSKENTAKKTVAKLYRLFIGAKLSKPIDKELFQLLENPEFIRSSGRQAPIVINGIFEIIHTITHTFEHLPKDKKEEIIGNLVAEVDTGKLAEIITSFVRTTDSLRIENPTYFTEKIIPQIQNWLDHTDFGELREIFDNAKEDYDTLIVKLCELAFEYPAKFIILLSFIPGITNFAILFMADITERFNTLSPDMLADILLTFFRELDGNTLGKLLNNVTEVIRQIHTGSALVGESGAPRFTMDLSGKTREVLEKTDPKLFIKARNALIDGKETLIKTFMDIAAENPEFLVHQLNHLSVNRNSKTRILKQKIELLEDLPEDVSIDALEKGLANWTTYDLADIVNSLSRIANTLHHSKPEVLTSLLSEFVGSLDLYEIEESLRWLAKDMGQVVRPLARTVTPIIIKEFCGFFTPEDDGQDEALQESLEMLRGIILKEEERS